jgi:dipeptidyl-peptidase 4
MPGPTVQDINTLGTVNVLTTNDGVRCSHMDRSGKREERPTALGGIWCWKMLLTRGPGVRYVGGMQINGRILWTHLMLGALGGESVGDDLPNLPPKPPAVYQTGVRAHWFADNSQFWYRNDLAGGGREFIRVNAREGSRVSAFDHAVVASRLGELTEKKISAEKLPIEGIRFVEDGKIVHLIGRKTAWSFDLKEQVLVKLMAGEWQSLSNSRKPVRRRTNRRVSLKERRVSPDKKWEAFVRDDDLWIRKRNTKEGIRLSDNGTEADSYRFDVTSDRAISMQYGREAEDSSVPDVYWSPDSKRLIALRTKVVPERSVQYVEVTPKGRIQPEIKSYPYLKPGDPVPVRTVHLFDIAATKEIPVANDLMGNPWRLTKLQWAADSGRFTLLYNERGHAVMRLLGIDAVSGDVSALVEERSDTFIDYAYKTYLRFSEADDGFIWMSERDGWNHLYRYGNDGTLKSRITKGKWMVRSVTHIDEGKRQIWFDAMGVRPGQDPYFIHRCRVNFDGSGFAVLTEGDGTHSVMFSPDRKHFVDTWSRVDLPPVHELRRSRDGKLVCELERADVTAWLKAGYRFPERFVAKGRDGETDIHGVIHRPRKFDPKKRYPVIENIYAGPHGAFAPKSFRHDYTHRREIIESGFIIVQMDGMGTNWRGKKFHDVCWKNIGDAGFSDRIAWIKAAAKTRPWMDLSRVGIYGGSAGGQNAMRALIAHADFYHVAIADCGCHDNRMDKIWWNEAWMGWPVKEHYRESSNVVQAHRMKGELMLMLGGEDRNVDPASTLQVVDALVKAGKDFEFVLQPSAGHGSGETAYGKKRRLDFFQRKLLGRN